MGITEGLGGAVTVRPMPPADDDEVLTSAEAAELLKVSERAVQEWTRTGELPARPMPGKRPRYRYSRSVLLAWIRNEPIPESEYQQRQPPE